MLVDDIALLLVQFLCVCPWQSIKNSFNGQPDGSQHPINKIAGKYACGCAGITAREIGIGE
jgi:hypothetical protein